MAVYTSLSNNDIAQFLDEYDIGELVSAEGISEGISNTNYLITVMPHALRHLPDGVQETPQQVRGDKYILTVFEARTPPADLPFFMGLTERLADRGVPCPRPVKGKDGSHLAILKGKPAAIVEFLEGRNNPDITPAHLARVGDMVAQMQRAASDFPMQRRNLLSLDAWRVIFDKLRGRVDSIAPGLEQELQAELEFLRAHWPKGLPGGVVHTDIFPDNVFFSGEGEQLRITGVIDFYYSCSDYYVYDLLICMNAWCFDSQHQFLPERARALWQGYEKHRTLSADERAAIPVLARAASMRFLATRAYDWLNRVEGAVLSPKDPMEYVAKLRFHQQVKDCTEYGL